VITVISNTINASDAKAAADKPVLKKHSFSHLFILILNCWNPWRAALQNVHGLETGTMTPGKESLYLLQSKLVYI